MEQPPPVGTRRPRRRMRVVLIAACAVVIAVVAVGAASGAFGGGDQQADASAPSGPPATAKVQRTTLTSSQAMDGQLGYGGTSAVQAPSPAVQAQSTSGSAQSGQSAQGGGAASSGIVTWMPSDGDTITRGKPVYKVDQRSVPLLYGSVPLYRTLSPGSSGSDVKMLEQNLHALGYRGFTVDDTYDSGTAAAVEKWQENLGRSQTGEVKAGDAVVASSARRVAKAELALGAALSGNVLTWTGTDRVISVDLPVQYAELAKKGRDSTVTLPDNTTLDAVVTDIGTPTSSSDSSDSGSSPQDSSDAPSSSDATVPVELKAKDTNRLGSYQAASVSVEFAAKTRENVLAVPINALFALPHGGYAVEVVTGSKTEYRTVKLGMFGNGMVEISGAGITEGTVVGVPE